MSFNTVDSGEFKAVTAGYSLGLKNSFAFLSLKYQLFSLVFLAGPACPFYNVDFGQL